MDDRLNHGQKMFSKQIGNLPKKLWKVFEFVILKIYTKEVHYGFNGKWVV